MENSKAENTLLIVKHDGVARGLMGEIITRCEKTGLKLVAMEFMQSTNDMGENHYPRTEKWLRTVGERTLKDYLEKGIDPVISMGTDNPIEIGKKVKNWLIEYLAAGPVLAMVWQGPGAVNLVRKIVGDTVPARALMGTIRGDFCLDTPEMANKQERPIYNIVHASGEVAEANEEIALWFGNREVFDYHPYSSDFNGIKGKISNLH